MMTLTTVSKKTSAHSALVYWSVGMNRRGVLDVHIDFDHDESDLLAELSAMQYLTLEKQVFGRSPGDGGGYKFVVSKGAIRKLALGKSSKRFAQKYASLLTGRMGNATIKVSHDMGFASDLQAEQPERLDADHHHYTQTFDRIDTPALGWVWITKHAVEQYQERLVSDDIIKPWASLRRRLQNPDLQQKTIPARVLKHKARKYGRADNLEVWAHPDSMFRYLLIKDDDGKKVLVTVFRATAQE